MKFHKEMKVYLAHRNVFGFGNIDIYASYGFSIRPGLVGDCWMPLISSNQKKRVLREWKGAWKNYCVDWNGGDE